jgi:hypothetical protein
MRRLILLPLLALLAGCSPSEPYWIERHVPTTLAERQSVAEMTTKILAATPTSLAGHDQDWDDAIEMAQETAAKTLCEPTYWERAQRDAGGYWDYTGRWRYATPQPQPQLQGEKK